MLYVIHASSRAYRGFFSFFNNEPTQGPSPRKMIASEFIRAEEGLMIAGLVSAKQIYSPSENGRSIDIWNQMERTTKG
jgi:hypothetical protein